MAEIISPDYFFINGISSETVGLYVDTPPVPPMAKQRVAVWKTGIDSDNSSPDDVWEPIQLTLSCYMFSKENFDMSAVYAFLANARTLQISRFSSRYFKIMQVNAITPQQQHDGKRIKIQIQFACNPFKYHVSNPEIPITENKLENPGTRYSRPLYKITHEVGGDTILSVNGQTCTINYQASSPIYIDAERMIAYNDSGVNQTQYTAGLFPFLAPGMNLLSVVHSSGISSAASLTVKGNWRDY